MTAKTSQNQSNRNDDVDARITVLEYQFSSVSRALDRIEAKQDASITQINNMKNVTTHEFDENNKMIANTYVTVESIKSLRTLFWAIIISLITGLVSLGFFFIQKAVA